MKNHGVPVVREGWAFAAVAALATLVCVLAGWWFLALASGAVTLYILYFFRNPERLPPVGASIVASPADGRVIFAGLAVEPEFSHEERIKVSIFMNLFDVHVNRMPIDGTLRDTKYSRGRFMAASEEGASEENERNALLIETSKNQRVVLVQVAGLVARRVITYPSSGTFVLKGQRIGLIRFGSRCDVYLPIGSQLLVKVGDKVLGGESSIAQLSESGG